MEDEIAKNLGLGKLLQWLSCLGLLDATIHVKGGAGGCITSWPNQDQEPFCDTEIKVTKQGLFGLSDLSDCTEIWGVPERSPRGHWMDWLWRNPSPTRIMSGLHLEAKERVLLSLLEQILQWEDDQGSAQR